MNKYYFRASGRSSNIRVGRTNQFTCINQILYSPQSKAVRVFGLHKGFPHGCPNRYSVTSRGGVGAEFSNSRKELEGFNKFLPVGLDSKLPGLEYLLHSSLTLLLPQGWEEATRKERDLFLLGSVWDTPHLHLSLWNSPLPGVWRRITETWQIINISWCERKGFVTQWLEHHDFLSQPGGK